MLIKHKKNKSSEHFLKEKKNKNLMRGGATTFDTEFINRFDTIYRMGFIGNDLRDLINPFTIKLIEYIQNADGTNEGVLFNNIKLEFQNLLGNNTIIATGIDINPFIAGLSDNNLIERIISFINNNLIQNYITDKFQGQIFFNENDNNQQIKTNVESLTAYYLDNNNLGTDDLDMTNPVDQQVKTDNDALCRDIDYTLNATIQQVTASFAT